MSSTIIPQQADVRVASAVKEYCTSMSRAIPECLDHSTTAGSVPISPASRFLILGRDGKYGSEVKVAVRSMSLTPIRTSFKRPWQNRDAERWIESCWRGLLDHVIPVDERHLRRLMAEYIRLSFTKTQGVLGFTPLTNATGPSA
jgi:hypothetical protein